MVRHTKQRKARLSNIAKARVNLLKRNATLLLESPLNQPLNVPQFTPATFEENLNILNASNQSTATLNVNPINPVVGSYTCYSSGSDTKQIPILPKGTPSEYNSGNYNGNINCFAFVPVIANNVVVLSPVTGLQPLNLVQLVPKIFHCLLCSKETTLNLTSLNNYTEAEADFLAVFVLKKMLGVPSENLGEYLSMLGHPRGWISICTTCAPTVNGAFTVQKQIGELERKLRRLQNIMRKEIMDSYVENQKKFKSVGAIPAPIAKSNPVVVTRETRNYVVTDMERINLNRTRLRQETLNSSVTNHHDKDTETTTLVTSSASETKELPVDSDPGWDFHDDFDEPCNKVTTMSTTPTNDVARPSCKFSNDARKRKQTITVRQELADKCKSINLDKCNVLEGTAEQNNGIHSTSTACQDASFPGEVVDQEANLNFTDMFLQKLNASLPPSSRRNDVFSRSSTVTKSTVASKLMKFKQVFPNNEVWYGCAMCPHLKSMTLRSFVKHLVFHYDRPYKCSECTAYFTDDRFELNKHSNQNDNGSHVCCKETLVKVKLTTGKIWGCGNCPDAFKLETEREFHEANAHPDKVSIPLPHDCSKCSKKFRDYPEWQIHRALEHPDLAKLGCFYCDEVFKFKIKEAIDVCNGKARNDHIRKHHGPEYPLFDPFACNICGVNFKTESELKSHANTEHGYEVDKPHSCPVCFKNFKHRPCVRGHILSVHCQQHRDRFICDVCTYGTMSYIYLVEHRFLKHGIAPEKEGTKIYSCATENCTFKCVQRGTFDIHMMKAHNAERPYKCNVCGKGFMNSTQFNDHKRIHTTLKPFQCEICGNSFAVRNYLYIHKRLSHQKRPFASTHKKRLPRSRKFAARKAAQNSSSPTPLVAALTEHVVDHADPSSPPSPSLAQSITSSLHLLADSAAIQPSCNNEGQPK